MKRPQVIISSQDSWSGLSWLNGLRTSSSGVRILSMQSIHKYRKLTETADFQQAKKEYQKTAKPPPKYLADDLDRGFVVTGLWSWSRHPNFAAEQGMLSLTPARPFPQPP